MSVIDFSKRRFDAAKNCDEITAVDALREAIRQIEAGEINCASAIAVLLLDHPDGGTSIDLLHGGPASTDARIAMFARGQHMMIWRD